MEERTTLDLAKLRKLRPRDYAVRFGFGAAISVVAALLGLLTNYRLAGMFLAFPAILPAALTLVEHKEGPAQAASDVRGAAVGAVAMMGFAIVAVVLLKHSPALALPAALSAWIVASLLIYTVLRLAVRTLGERQFLPEIATTEGVPVIECLSKRGLTLALAESCTGGVIASLLTSGAGAGQVIRGGVVAYSDAAKSRLLGVPPELIESQGAVSAGVAREMARGAKQRFDADVGLSVTGFLGPSKPGEQVGLTYIALCTPDDRVLLRQYSEDHGPGRNRERDVRMALRLVVEAISAEG
jgi:PncC family amidohydrolase